MELTNAPFVDKDGLCGETSRVSFAFCSAVRGTPGQLFHGLRLHAREQNVKLTTPLDVCLGLFRFLHSSDEPFNSMINKINDDQISV
jgi:hypothetical protein